MGCVNPPHPLCCVSLIFVTLLLSIILRSNEEDEQGGAGSVTLRYTSFNIGGFCFKTIDHYSACSSCQHSFDNLDEVVPEIEVEEHLIDVVVTDTVKGFGEAGFL